MNLSLHHHGLGWPDAAQAAPKHLGWPSDVSRETGGDNETEGSAHVAGDQHDDTHVSRETGLNAVDVTTDGDPTQSHRANVSRETDAEVSPAGDAELVPSVDCDPVSRETSQPQGEPDDATAAAASVEAPTAEQLRAELAASMPVADDDTPLARAIAVDTQRRITLTGRVFPKPTRTRVLTVANQKGGVGKTTTAVNVAAALAQSGLTVLVVDLDPQGNASTALGVEHRSGVTSVYDALVDGMPLREIVRESPHVPNLFCVPSTIDLAGAEIELVSLVARETRLARALTALLAETAYDYVFIDCPPSLGLLTINAFVAAQEVFIPIQCEYYALEGLSQLLRNIELIRTHLNPALTVSTILLTMFDGRTRLSAQVAEDVRTHFPEQTLRTTIPRSVRVSEAPSFGQTVMTYDPLNSGALAYLEAASQIADAGAQQSAPTEGPQQ